MSGYVKLHERDSVIIALRQYEAGEQIQLEDGIVLKLLEDIPQGHKIAATSIQKGEQIFKFGYSIGKATATIEAGQWVHTHNLKTALKGTLDYRYEPNKAAFAEAEQASRLSPFKQQTFYGYRRANGEVAIRNEIWIINTVGCINKTCEIVAKQASALYSEQVDGVYHFAHPFGCSQLGDDLMYTQKLLAALVNHPHAAGVLVMGLGCENNQIELFKQAIGEYDEKRIKFIAVQQAEDEIAESLELIEQLADYASTFKREAISIAELKIGLKCGGSDGLSGITANPLAGKVADRLTAAGGSVFLTEVPEMFGAELILMERAATTHVFESMVCLINDFKDYFVRHGQEIYENPSPGNKDGGITTLEEKSLGCTQKGGHAIVTDVIKYGERAKQSGLTLIEGPGNDLISVTALSAAGAHLVIFTTGRGTPFGGPVPTMKVSTNSALAAKKKNWIDFNAGELVDGKTMEQLTNELWQHIIAIASGEKTTLNEQYGLKEIAIFKDGVIL